MTASPEAKSLTKRFSEVYSFYIPEYHRSFFSPNDLDNFLQARLRFFSRFDGSTKIEVHNPPEDFFWLVNSSIIETIMVDAPFIVDTLLDYCKSNDIRVNLVVHPVLRVARASGQLQDVNFASDSEPKANERDESYVYLEIGRRSPADLKRIQKEIQQNLIDLETIVQDFPKMRDSLEDQRPQDPQDLAETRWLIDNFVLLGAARLNAKTLGGPHLGLLRKSALRSAVLEECKQLRSPARELRYVETSITSDVNRRKRLQLVIVGPERGDRLVLLGHFSHKARHSFRTEVPTIQNKLGEIANALRAAPESHVRKELYKAAEVLPLSVLVTRGVDLLAPMLTRLTASVYQDDAEFVFHFDKAYNLLWIQGLVPVRDAGQIPGQKFADFRQKHQLEVLYEIRHELNRNQAVFIACRSPKLSLDELRTALEENSDAFFSSWSSRFRRLIGNRFVGEQAIHERMRRYFAGINPDYELHLEPEETIFDIGRIEQLQAGEFSVHYYAKNGLEDCIKVYTDKTADLSTFVPVLTNFGFTIQRERTFPYTREDSPPAFIFAFFVPGEERTSDDRRRLAAAVAAVLNHHATSEPVNALAKSANLSAEDLRLLKALAGYVFQIDKSYSRLYLQQTLLRYPTFSAALVNLFRARHSADAKARGLAEGAIKETFGQLESVVDEALCRTFESVVKASVRTNLSLGRAELAIKIRSAQIENMPRPVPLYEIYVYAHDLEGIHLRGGMTARGGLRWSDRPDDFRTEILGLMKAQMVKNTVIVPVGSKGGFVLKNRSFANRDEFRAAGVAGYRRYIQCLLDLTDNMTPAGKVQPAKNVERLDGDDAYLVVAADKGTATFSDIANEISEHHQFWLGDAFASGGRFGYDHKVQGITARGAWESVKRHFHELGQDPEKDPITIAGIGDMSGDVFGNGLLLSKSAKLVAAFNHLYIFLDPNPDPARSFAERKRLFQAGLNWNDYDPKLISAGGGIFDRGARKLTVSKAAKQSLGLEKGTLSGEELIQAILAAPVDLLWNGGIGTYIKATNETHYQAGDPGNDRVRIDATQLRARVVGEGGNLGLTQAARVQAAGRGVRINTDAIDNSAGVDMSDHEVNLKILLNGLVRRKTLKDVGERNKLIRRYEAEEIDLVLAHNYQNNLALSVDQKRTPEQFTYLRALIKFLNREGLFSREADSIPFEADLDRIEESNRLLPRPVLCSLMGFTKLFLAGVLDASDEFRDPSYDRLVLRYFPKAAGESFTPAILKHPLKREIIITEVVNESVNRAGIAFYQRMYMRTGLPLEKIAHAYMTVAEFLDPAQLRERIDPWLQADVHYTYLQALEEQIFQIVRRVLEEKEEKLVARSVSLDFVKLLEHCATFAQFRMPRELRTPLRSVPTQTVQAITACFEQVDVLQDAYVLFKRNQSAKKPWSVEEYFQALDRYRIRDLRRVVRSLNPESSWEILFLSKLDHAIEDMTAALIEADRGDGPADEKRLMALLAEMTGRSGGATKNAAALYEMLEHAQERLIQKT